MRKLLSGLLLFVCGHAFAQLPPGFVDELVAGSLSQPVAITFAPDGRMFILQKAGTVRIVSSSGVLLAGNALTLSVTWQGTEQGLVGIALDPLFSENGYVYLYYTTGPESLNAPATPKNRISRFVVDGNTILLNSETILVDNIPSDTGLHNGGCMRFGPDGMLYVSTGDGGTPTSAQDLTTLAGSILRLNKDGTVPSDNPFFGQPGVREEIYLYGLRNPFRFSFRPGTGSMFVSDVGQSSWEEINVAVPGGNYGWPVTEGPTTNPLYISPAYAYPHEVGKRGSVIGGIFMTAGSFPSPYEGSYFFADYVRDTIRRLTFDNQNVLTGEFDFAPGLGVVDFATGPAGELYYVSLEAREIRRIAYKPKLVSVGFEPEVAIVGTKALGTVTIEHPAPAIGAVVGLRCTSGAKVPTSVFIPAGQSEVSFTIQVYSSATAETVTVTASKDGETKQGVLALVDPPNAQFVAQDVPETMIAGKNYLVSITMLNTGDSTWTHDTGYRLASYSPVNNTTWGRSRMFITNGASVEPGQQYTYSVNVRAPSTPGDYTFQWRSKLDEYKTFGETSELLTIQVVASPEASELESYAVPGVVTAGSTFTATLTYKNTGTSTWTDAGGYRLASRNPADNKIWGYNRVFIPQGVSVLPGQSHAFSRTFKAPATPGTYVFSWKILLNGSGTFGEECFFEIVVE